jgi:hypothetical protein
MEDTDSGSCADAGCGLTNPLDDGIEIDPDGHHD